MEVIFSRIRAKKSAQESRKHLTPAKKTPVKVLSSAKKSPNQSPKLVALNIKSKLESNRVKQVIRKFENEGKNGDLSPPRGSEKVKLNVKKSYKIKKKLSASPNQPKINTFFGKEKL